MQPSLSRAEFIDLARSHTVVPVAIEVMSDRETAVSVFEKLVGTGEGFLLESVEGGESWARWSFVGWDAAFTLLSDDGECSIEGTVPRSFDLEGDPLTVLERALAIYRIPDLPGLPPLHSGAVGYLGYDAVRYVESLPARPTDDRGLPEMMWQFVGAMAALDRFRQTITILRNVYVGDDPGAQYDEAVEALARHVATLGAPLEYRPEPIPDNAAPAGDHESTMNRAEFEAAVITAKEHIRQGDAFQIVVAQRLGLPFTGDPLDVYRALRVINPSPFMTFLRHSRVTLAGASPELMTRVRDGRVYSRPIAGTRPRGSTQEEDQRFAAELLADPKERAEHVMLIDLARNDVGRVCEFGTVEVDDLMVVERYSHVMHIVSQVSGSLRPGVSGVDVLRATFPHGTVSGAPKVRAMEIIDQLEPVARGPYAGAVGYLDLSGNVDTAICLRTVVFADDTAWVQAGAGLVADSDPAIEYDETMNKAAAALSAVAATQ